MLLEVKCSHFQYANIIYESARRGKSLWKSCVYWGWETNFGPNRPEMNFLAIQPSR